MGNFFSDHTPELPPEVRHILVKVQKLPPEEMKVLNAVLDTWAEPDKPIGE